MIRSVWIYESTCTDPYRNLAVEQQLLETVGEGQCVLYLWQNRNTVVIGRNQNPWKECRTTLLSREGGHLARRLSGGGAVFHDLGNLNFTFLVCQEDYDLDRQLSVIEQAVQSLGIPVRRSGRNDMLADGRKFSGNAFYKNGRQAYHHGTLLMDVDLERLNRYLSPSRAKLQAKGVDSVRSRVVNLKELAPQISLEALKQALRDAFGQVYGQSIQPLEQGQLDMARINALTERNRSWEWNFGQKLPFTFEREGRFSWGGLHIQLQITEGIIRQAKLYSDAMDWSFAPAAEEQLAGCRFEQASLQERLRGIPFAEDICRMIQ